MVAPGSATVRESFAISRNSLLRFSGPYMAIAATAGMCRCAQSANPALGTSSGTTYFVDAGGSDRNTRLQG